MLGRRSGEYEESTTCDRVYSCRGITRLTFTAPDGTEYEFIDERTGGVPSTGSYGCGQQVPPGASRGTVFVTRDGTAMTFVSDAEIFDSYTLGTGQYFNPSGFLMMRDGTRYRIRDGVVDWIRDRNGNRLSFLYDASNRVREITDSLNRKVWIEYLPSQDKINDKGFGEVIRTITVNYTAMANVMATDRATGQPYPIKKVMDLFPDTLSLQDYNYNPTKVESVELPDQSLTRRYRFYYNSYGELAQIKLPTGGTYEYDYAGAGNNGSSTYGLMVYRRVKERRVDPDGDPLNGYEGKTTYSIPPITGGDLIEVKHRNPSESVLASEKHYFHGTALSSYFYDPWSDPLWNTGREHKLEAYDTNGTTLLRRVEHTWQNAAHPGGPRVVETRTTLADTNQVAKQTFVYDQYNNKTDAYEYDFGSAFAVRHTHTDYLTVNPVNGDNYAGRNGIHLRSLPWKQFIYSVNPTTGVETLAAKTEFEYDNYSADANHAALVDRPNISGHDGEYTTLRQTRGNLTSTSRWLDTTNSWISIYQQYDIAGNVVKVIDARGKQTAFDFTDRFGVPDGEARANSGAIELGALMSYAFPTLETNAVGHSAYTQYDYYNGRTVDTEDENGVINSAAYDLLDRPTQIIEAANVASLKNQTSFTYDDDLRTVTVASDQVTYGDNQNKRQVVYDGLGRQIEERNYETASAYIVAQQTYDSMGRPNQVSNPFRAGDTIWWTTTSYDALGRVRVVTAPGGAQASSAYTGNKTILTDEANKVRHIDRDALGRVTRVVEDPSIRNYETTYTYNALDNLTRVTQGTQPARNFTYDSLGRLRQASIPEQTSPASYTYDANSNLETRTDPRGIVTTFTYDDVNRIRTRSYSDSTPGVTYTYDAPAVLYSKGRLTSVSSSISSYHYDEYDALGQIKRTRQVTDGQEYRMSYGYDLAGNLTSQVYPSGRTISTGYDAANRVNNLSGQKTGEPTRTYASSISYTAHHLVKQMQLGNGLWEHTVSNERLQLTEIGLGTSAAVSDKLKLNYTYGVVINNVLDATKNNGNVESHTITVGGTAIKQSYLYDELNRLASVQEAVSGTSRWLQTYGFDRHANRTSLTNSGSEAGLLPTQSTPPVDSATNRLAGFTYDNSGNLLADNVGNTFTYDAEDHQVSHSGAFGASNYSYDGDGRRVKKVSSGVTTLFVYNFLGQLVAEYTNAVQQPQGGTSYVTPDHLGSNRIVTDASGNVKARHDYLPYGEELDAGVSNRTTAIGYSVADTTRQRFTSKERDAESGLDYFGARYYASRQGRFTGVDPLMASAEVTLPQTWNRYAYVINNPLALIDPDGMDFVAASDGSVFYDSRVHSQADVDKYYPKRNYSYLPYGSVVIIASGPYTGYLATTQRGGPNHGVFRIYAKYKPPTPKEINFWAGYGQKFLAAYLRFAAEEIVTTLTGAKAVQALDKLYDLAKAAKASKRTLNVIQRSCFAAGTKVLTREGEKAIEELQVGDEVLAADPQTGEAGYRRVTQTLVRSVTAVLDICVEGVIITCTPEHPFWVKGKGWVEARGLVQGSPLVTKGGQVVQVESVKRRTGSFPVYNIEVERLHTYFVSKLAVLVHNGDCQILISPVAPDWATKGAHIKVNGVELAVRPGMDGEIVFKSIFSSADPKEVEAAIKIAQQALENDVGFQRALLRTSKHAVEYLGKGSKLARARSGEVRFLVKALQKMGIE